MNKYKSCHVRRYHMAFVPAKFLVDLLREHDYKVNFEKIIRDIAKKYNYELKLLSISSDRIYLFVQVDMYTNPKDILNNIKGETTSELLSVHPDFADLYDKYDSFWDDEDLISTMGVNVSVKCGDENLL